ncbi:hypothetical protein BJX76DRAFT_354164 [Aspergillus varians]
MTPKVPRIPLFSSTLYSLSSPPTYSFTMFIARGLPLVNFAVASSALAFQIFVLEPWHNTLDDEFKALKVEHLRVLDRIRRLEPSSDDKPTIKAA